MARIPLIQENDPTIPADAIDFLREIGRGRVGVLNIHRAFANHPKVGRAFFEFSKTVRVGNTLPPAQAELAYTAATVANSCFY